MKIDETVARRILAQAIAENRCASLLDCLFAGGSVTIDAKTGDLVMMSGGLNSNG